MKKVLLPRSQVSYLFNGIWKKHQEFPLKEIMQNLSLFYNNIEALKDIW